jgi:hypothetical protein
MATSINKISKEDIVKVLNVFLFALLMWCTIKCEETHEICKLAVNVSEYLEGRFGLEDNWLTDDDFLSKVAERNDLLCFEGDLECLCVHKVIGLHKHIKIFDCNIHFVT